jgi:hypothetical protein
MSKQQQYLEGFPLSPQQKKNQLAFFKRIRLIIQLIAAALGLYYGYLQLSGLEVEAFKTDGFADTLMKITLLIYYLAWLKGNLMDLKDEEAIFMMPPNKGKFSFSAIMMILLLAIIFFFLCYFKSKRIFALILDAFMISNIYGWQYLIKFISDSVKENKEFYNSENKNFRNEYLRIMVEDYLKGCWQYWRFGVGIFMLIIINILVFTNFSLLISSGLNLKSAELVKAIGFIIFITVFEGWIWYMRLRRSVSLNLIDKLDEEYYMTKRHKEIMKPT